VNDDSGGAAVAARRSAARRSTVWSAVFRVSYRVLRVLDPVIRSWLANGWPGLTGVVEVRTIGRRSGRSRSTLVTLLVVDGRWYVGHPNGDASWIRNAVAAGWLEVEPPAAAGPRRAVVLLPAGPERDAVIHAAQSQQPFPANVLYRAARRHVAAAGVYLRLEPTTRTASASAS